MPKAKHQNAAVSAAVLRVASAKGWQGASLAAIAKEAKIPLATLKKRYASPHEIIPVVIEEMTREALAGAGKVSGSPRDVVFDLLMARFDVLQKNRKAVLSIADAARRDPALACTLGCAVRKSMSATAAAAKLDVPLRSAMTMGLSVVYGLTFLAWRKDNTRDMAKTMATLDRALKLAEKAAELLKPRS
jgi:AcrR family transcriptional regulator